MSSIIRPVPRKLISIFLVLWSVILFVFITTTAQASYDPYNSFATEVLLNKPGSEYDLSMFDGYTDNGSVKIIEVKNEGDIFDEEHNWDTGTYYVYRSHYNEDLGVIIHEVKETVTDLYGLSVTLAIPTEWNEATREWEEATLGLDAELELNKTLINFMERKGYDKSIEENVNGNLSLLAFSKDEIIIYIIKAESNNRPEMLTYVDNNVIMVEGPNGTLDDNIEQDLKDMLKFLNIESTEWDKATRQSYMRTDQILIPVVDIDPNKFDWGTAMCMELKWLTNQFIFTNLTAEDIQKIGMLAKAPYAGWNYRIVYEKGTWKYYNETEDPKLIFDSSGLNLNLADLPDSESMNGTAPTTEDISYIIILIVSTLIVIIIVGIFSYSRLNKRSILDNLNRKRIFECIKENEGIHVKALLRELDLKPGTLSHHLNVLEKEEYIKSLQDGIYRRFYVFEDESELNIILSSIQKKILDVVNERPGITQSKVSRVIGSNRMLVNYHMKILRDAGILIFEKKGREHQYFISSNAIHFLQS